MARHPFLFSSFLLFGCGGESASEKPSAAYETVVIAPLVDLEMLTAEEDPLSAHRPTDVDCNNLTGWYVEGDVLEANTAACNYLALDEPASNAAHAGEVLKTELSHFDLTAPEEAEAHVALLVESDVIWEQSIAIPGKAQRIELSIELERAIEKGARIGFHLHNHGQNTWNLSPLVVERKLPTESSN